MPASAQKRPLHVIAAEIRETWPKVNYAAEPYLEAMERLDSINNNFGHDDAKGVVIRFVGNASSWRGDDARRIKAELREMTK